MTTNLTSLIERLRAAKEGSRELDLAIARHFNLGWDYGAEWPTVVVDGVKGSEPTAYRYTTDLSVIVALVEKRLDCWWVMAKGRVTDAEPLFACQLLKSGTDDELSIAEGPTLPIAICIALLLALQSEVSNV